MCYFVSVGARAPARLLAQVFEQQAELEVAASPICAPVAAAFPVEDVIRLVTWRGCSCDLVGPGKRSSSAAAHATKLAAAFQRSVLSVARHAGSVRLLVHRHREPCQLPAPRTRLALTAHEFMSREHWFVEDVVMEISGGESASPQASW